MFLSQRAEDKFIKSSSRSIVNSAMGLFFANSRISAESRPKKNPTISYQNAENMNSRTAEQGTVEYRSKKYCFTALKNFCCSKFLVRYSIFYMFNKKSGDNPPIKIVSINFFVET